MISAKTPPRRMLPGMLAVVLAASGVTARPAPPAADGIVVLSNRDDDDRDGTPDADDERVNGAADARDLATLAVPLPVGTTVVRLDAGPAPLRFFVRDAEGWRHVGLGRGEVPARGAEALMEILVEAVRWAGQPTDWTGRATVHAACMAGTQEAGVREIAVQVAPVRLLPATAPVEEAYVATGRYDNVAFAARLGEILGELRVPLRTYATRDWREMWMQDTMEVGTATAGAAAMAVVLGGLRNADTFPPTLLGPDVAVATVGAPRPLAGGDAWADWYGNLEASIPTAAHPHGRAIHGRNRLTGCSFHPEVVAFLAAQQVQSPIWIDTSWLLIKHVDEIVSFLPGADGRGAIVVPDPVAGLALLGDDAAAGDPEAAARRREANTRIARAIDVMLHGDADPPRAGGAPAPPGHGSARGGGLLDLLGLDDRQVVRLPVAFDVPAAGLLADGGVTDASSLWSNPVNALFVNGTVICGAAGMPEAGRDVCRERFLAAGASRVEFIDDGVYQKNHGNVHCATNARRRDEAGTAAP
ncbi:MAG: protein-arginine deiminase family protein [Planctomycetaceae bacterium]